VGDLPRWKTQDFSKWWKIQRFFKVVRNKKISQNGFIVMDNRPNVRWKEFSKRSDCDGWPTQVKWNVLKRRHDRAQRHYLRDGSSKERSKRDRTRRGMRAEKRTWKEAGLENALPEKWGLKGALERRQGYKTHYPRWSRALRRTQKEAGLENTLPKVVEGSKMHSKWGRVRKHNTHEVRARRRTKKR
jgi:hypothetical protein